MLGQSPHQECARYIHTYARTYHCFWVTCEEALNGSLLEAVSIILRVLANRLPGNKHKRDTKLQYMPMCVEWGGVGWTQQGAGPGARDAHVVSLCACLPSLNHLPAPSSTGRGLE